MGRLSGRRIIVTRSAERAAALTELLRVEGADVVELASIETVDAPDGGEGLREALESIDRYEWLVVTSPEGARRVRSAAPDLGHSRVRIAAVGRATAEAIGRADLVPAVHTGAGLGDAFPSGSGHVLLAVALDAGSDFEIAARAKGWTVNRIAAYATLPVPLDPRVVRDAVARADAVLFASGSAVGSWARSVGNEVPPLVVAIGPSTAQVLSDVGIAPVVIAVEQSLQGLVDTVVSELAPDRRP